MESLRQLLLEDRFSIVFDCGFSTPITKVTVDHISSIIKAVSLHCVLRIKAEIDQIAEGLELFNVLRLIRKYPTKIRGLFIFNPDCKATLDEMTILFQPKYSNDQSSRKVIEEASVMYWNEFLQDVSHGIISMLTICCLFNLLVVEGSYTFHFNPESMEH